MSYAKDVIKIIKETHPSWKRRFKMLKREFTMVSDELERVEERGTLGPEESIRRDWGEVIKPMEPAGRTDRQPDAAPLDTEALDCELTRCTCNSWDVDSRKHKPHCAYRQVMAWKHKVKTLEEKVPSATEPDPEFMMVKLSEERRDVATKVSRLEIFIGEDGEGIPYEERIRLHEQLKLMRMYRDVLGRRANWWMEKTHRDGLKTRDAMADEVESRAGIVLGGKP